MVDFRKLMILLNIIAGFLKVRALLINYIIVVEVFSRLRRLLHFFINFTALFRSLILYYISNSKL